MFDLLVFDQAFQAWLTVDGFYTEEEAEEQLTLMLGTVDDNGHELTIDDFIVEYVG
jgi:hypothetical protein